MPKLSRRLHAATRTVYIDLLRILDRHIASACLVLFLVALWPLTHRYKGLGGDAGLYAVQALAKIHTNLAGDLFLQNNSQDRYTVFSPLYAWCIRWLGLRAAAMAILIVLKVWFFAAAWALAQRLFDRRTAFLSTTLVMVIAGSYGGYAVFNYSEDWLTARTLAEPMVITAMWLYFLNFKMSAIFLASAAVFVHPLMALPGLALLSTLRLPLTLSTAGAVLGVAAALAAAIVALHQPPDVGALSIMDADWVETVRERSVFLFPHLWSARDWALNALPFISLAISGRVLHDSRIQKLRIAAALVGVTGLMVGFIAGTIGPVGVFLQGQVWRWVWITRFTAVILLAPTMSKLWRQDKCGHLCVVLSGLGWSLSPLYGAACLTTVLILSATRRHMPDSAAAYFRWCTIVLAGVVVVWFTANSWSIGSTPPSHLEPVFVTQLRKIFGFGVISMALAWSVVYVVGRTASRKLPAVLSVLLLICGLILYPGAFRVNMRDGSAEQIVEFSDWRRSIAPDDTVFVMPAHNSPAFAWFTLERPSYLTVDQSAGVVFSRATALEVRRRSNVLSPLMDPDWRLLSKAAGKERARVLTRDGLIGICSDPKLKFVVAREYLGFDPVIHKEAGDWKDWNLYDCRRVYGGAPPA